MATMKLEIITAERRVFSEDVEALVAPGFDGELGILPHHAPLMTSLKPGELVIRKGGQETYLAVTGGFLEVMGNVVTILADACERSEEIDVERAEAAMKRAQERLAARSADLDLQQAIAAVQRAQVRLRVAQRRRRPGGPPSAPLSTGA
ncbi:MAG: F0F1 ATP synthase subunit epsilon [Chloroflexota bacterium]|nr:F0F1 ATP synthase subunit epsilon [Chloroflexota bacterium]